MWAPRALPRAHLYHARPPLTDRPPPPPPTQAEARQPSEPYLPASLAAAADCGPWFSALGQPPPPADYYDPGPPSSNSGSSGGGGGGEPGLYVQGVEHLLAALEASGVDNARIEIEGGAEVPVVDGSAQVGCSLGEVLGEGWGGAGGGGGAMQ